MDRHRKNRMTKFSAALLLTVSLATIASANTTKPWWVNIGTGIVYGHNKSDGCTRVYSPGIIETRCRNINSNDWLNGENLMLSYNVIPKPHQLFSASYVQTYYDEFLSGILGTPKEKGYINAISVEYGLIQRWDYGYLSGTIGPAFVSNRGAYDNQEWFPPPSHSGIGLSGKIEAAIKPFRYLGFALTFVGNYNSNMPYYGIFLSLQFGKF